MAENLKRCPFCGSEVVLMNLFSSMKMFYCKNYQNCGAVVSFDNKECNTERGDTAKIRAWNRRAKNEKG